jgi:DNA-binding MarR family transcriptional regulator
LVTTQRSQDAAGLSGLEQLLSSRVSVLSRLLDRRLAGLLRDQFGLAAAEYRVLAQVLMHPQSTVRAIAARTYVDKAQVSRAVAVLEDQGLIERSAAADRRSPVFAATPDGRELAGEIMPLRRQQEDDLVASLDGAELATALAALDKLIAHVAPPPAAGRAEPPAAQRRRSIRAARGAIRAARAVASPGRGSQAG